MDPHIRTTHSDFILHHRKDYIFDTVFNNRMMSLRRKAGDLSVTRKASFSRIVASAYKRILITGGNTGIGYETALALLQKDYEVTLACRDTAKAQAAEEKLR